MCWGPAASIPASFPTLLVDGVAAAIAQSDALRVYILNVMTQDGETEGYTASDHVRALQRHSTGRLFDYCLANDAPIPPEICRRYGAPGGQAHGGGYHGGGTPGNPGTHRPGGGLVGRPGPPRSHSTGPGADLSLPGEVAHQDLQLGLRPGRAEGPFQKAGVSMSFSYQVKTELCREPLQRPCCALAEAYGVLLYGNTFTAREIRLITGNSAFIERLPRLFLPGLRPGL